MEEGERAEVSRNGLIYLRTGLQCCTERHPSWPGLSLAGVMGVGWWGTGEFWFGFGLCDVSLCGLEHKTYDKECFILCKLSSRADTYDLFAPRAITVTNGK